MKNTVIIYHKNCPDGFSSAWVAWKKFGNKAEYIAASHPSFPPKNIKDKEVYMLDFCYSKEHMKNLVSVVKKLVVIDHHISQKEAIKFSTENVFTVKNSGATLSWKYFFPNKKIPKLLLHIEDKDIWTFAIKGTEAYMAMLETIPFDFKTWDKLIKNFENPVKRKSYYEKGLAILGFSKQNIENIALSAEWVIFNNKKCLAVNSPSFVSEIGHILASRAKGIGIIWCKKNGKIKISLRSNGKVDVSKIALKKGGGGHRAAASFSIDSYGPIIKLPWKY